MGSPDLLRRAFLLPRPITYPVPCQKAAYPIFCKKIGILSLAKRYTSYFRKGIKKDMVYGCSARLRYCAKSSRKETQTMSGIP